MSDHNKLSEQDLDLMVYVMDVWLMDNDDHPAAGRVEDIIDKLSRCSDIKIKL
jgi:TolB-like protein